MSAKLSLIEGEKTELEAKYDAEVTGRRELEGECSGKRVSLDAVEPSGFTVCCQLSITKAARVGFEPTTPAF